MIENCCICQEEGKSGRESKRLLGHAKVGTPEILLLDLLNQCLAAQNCVDNGNRKEATVVGANSTASMCDRCLGKLLEYYEATLYAANKQKEFQQLIKCPALIKITDEMDQHIETFISMLPNDNENKFYNDVDDDADEDWTDESESETEQQNRKPAAANNTSVESEPLLTVATLELHENKQLPTRINRYCRECEVECPSEEVLKLHIKKFHPKNVALKANFNCAQCNSQFANEELYREHMLEAHNRICDFQCDICKRSFNKHTQFIAHLAVHKQYTCTICGKTLAHRRGLARHMETHSAERKYQCAECGNKYTTRSSLHKHTMIHNDIRNYKCPTCSNRFRSSWHLKRHQNTHLSAAAAATVAVAGSK